LEERTHGSLDLEVGVEHHLIGGVVRKTDGQFHLQLAAACLGVYSANQARPQDVKLRFAHGTFESEQQTVVEVARVVQTILVENERVGQRADLEQPVPVR